MGRCGKHLSFFAFVLRHRKKQKAATEIEDEDQNPVYGLYEFADGRNIDEDRSEVVDDNENYGLQERVEELVVNVEINP